LLILLLNYNTLTMKKLKMLRLYQQNIYNNALWVPKLKTERQRKFLVEFLSQYFIELEYLINLNTFDLYTKEKNDCNYHNLIYIRCQQYIFFFIKN